MLQGWAGIVRNKKLKNIMFKNFLLVIFLYVPQPATAGWFDTFFGYESYEACILDKMQGVTSDVAAHQIRLACKKMTSDVGNSNVCDKRLSFEEWQGVTGQASISEYTGLFNASIYNPIRNIKISKLEVEVTDTRNGTEFSRNLIVRRSAALRPLSSGDFTVDSGVSNIENFGWSILAVYGCEAE